MPKNNDKAGQKREAEMAFETFAAGLEARDATVLRAHFRRDRTADDITRSRTRTQWLRLLTDAKTHPVTPG